MSVANYIIYITMGCLVIQFMIGKLRLLSIIWLYHLQKKHEPVDGISVVICSRNDVENLKLNLHSILQQDYDHFEVIVVDDASIDGTQQYLAELQQQYQRLQCIRIDKKNSPGKKFALQLGIEASRHSYVLLTDADCKPASNGWIQSHAEWASSKHTVVLGYGKHQKSRGFLNLFIRYDTATIATQYMSKALWKYPYMGVGRNMAYSKDNASAFKNIDQSIASGDDDLFIQAVGNKSNFKVNLDPNSFTISKPKQTWKEWMIQKSRHTTTSSRYNWFTKISIVISWASQLVFYAGVIMILLTNNLLLGCLLFMMHTLSIMLFNGLWMKKLGEKDLILFIPILNFIYIFVQPLFLIKSWGRNKHSWS